MSPSNLDQKPHGIESRLEAFATTHADQMHYPQATLVIPARTSDNPSEIKEALERYRKNNDIQATLQTAGPNLSDPLHHDVIAGILKRQEAIQKLMDEDQGKAAAIIPEKYKLRLRAGDRLKRVEEGGPLLEIALKKIAGNATIAKKEKAGNEALVVKEMAITGSYITKDTPLPTGNPLFQWLQRAVDKNEIASITHELPEDLLEALYLGNATLEPLCDELAEATATRSPETPRSFQAGDRLLILQ